MSLEHIPDITKLSDRVNRVLGQNPGKFTLQGTNTYLIGSSNPYILLDTGEGLSQYLPILKESLSNPSNASLPDVSDIVLSHWHHDHVGGLSSVLSLLHDLWKQRGQGATYTPPKLHKFPLPEGALKDVDARWNQLPKLLSEIPQELYTPSATGPLHDLTEGQILTPRGGGVSLQVLHSPGHTLDSISLWIKEENALFTADTVLGQGTSVFEDLRLYLDSLQRLLSFIQSPSMKSGEGKEEVKLYPSHGPIVANGKATISMYIQHRLEREAQVVALLSTPPPNHDEEAWSTWDIVKTLYASYPENLWEPAMRGIELHLKKLREEGRVECVGGVGKEARWRLVEKRHSPSL